MSDIRLIERDDIPALAGMFRRVFGKPDTIGPTKLEDYLRVHYLDGPGNDPEIRSLVHVHDSGTIDGFVGVNVLPMAWGERRLRAAICGSLMVESRQDDPLAGARLLKAFLAGPQDLSFSETASEVSTAMWTRLKGFTLPEYSLEWVRVMAPLGFLVANAASRIGPAAWLKPLVRPIDGRIRKGRKDNALHWSVLPAVWSLPGTISLTEIAPADFAPLLDQFMAAFAVRPAWSDAQRDHIVSEATDKPLFGQAHVVRVDSRSGQPIGAFFYHAEPGGIGRVLQILARPGQESTVIDCLIGHAAQQGAVALRGRIQPQLFSAMLGKRIAFTHLASTVVHARDPALADALRANGGFFNGTAGEAWSRIAGGI